MDTRTLYLKLVPQFGDSIDIEYIDSEGSSEVDSYGLVRYNWTVIRLV